jgi:two-component system invasion response regulator UvrY
VINILIVDDHILVRKGTRALLVGEPDFNVIAEAGTYEEAVEQLGRHRADIVIVDIAMPGPAAGRDSLELLAHVKAVQPHARTIVLSMHPDNEYASRALRGGANGYVTKDVTPEGLVVAIRRVAGGAPFLSPKIAESLALRAALQDPVPLHGLSSRELTVFGMLANGKTTGDIARQLTLSAKTVGTHKLNVLRKLNLRTVADLVRYAIEHRVTFP